MFINNEELRKELSDNNLERVKNYYWDRLVLEYIKVLKN
jgi:glycosyltransferase involved in cell wall biosynthesis